MATFRTIASGSTGNCALLSDGDTHILIDAGVSMRRIRQALSEQSLTPDELTGIIITHDHTDHVAGLQMLTKYYSLPIFASCDTGRALADKFPTLRPCLRLFRPDEGFEMGNVYIKPFKTPHDAVGSVGYTLTVSGGRAMGFATDLGYMPDSVLEALTGLPLVVLEANHDPVMLKLGAYPPFLKDRILGDYGHLSNTSAGEAAVSIAEGGTERLILAHLSRENNTPELAEFTVRESLQAGGVCVGGDVLLDVAPAAECGKEYIL